MKWEQPSPRCDQWLNARCYEARDNRTKTSLTIIGLATTIYAGLLHCFNVETFAAASMLCAALVLFITSEEHHSAAIKQGMSPLIAVVGLVIGLAI